jgi:hypothetical protein
MPSVINAIQGRNASLDAAQEISETGINVAHSLEQATQGGINAIYQGVGSAENSIDTGVGSGNAAIASNAAAANENIASNAADANAALSGVYNTATTALQPYQAAGQQGIQDYAKFAGGEGAQAFQWDPSKDPGFQFRMQEAQKTMLKQAAARGGLQSGGFAKALGRNLQDYASNEYEKSFERDLAQKKFKQGMLSDLAGFGERANAQGIQAGEFYGGHVSANDMAVGSQLGQNFMQVGQTQSANDVQGGLARGGIEARGGESIADLGLRGAAAAGSQYDLAAQGRAAGHLGAANAWSGYLNDVNKALMLAAMGGD